MNGKKIFRVTISTGKDFESFIIIDILSLLNKINNDSKICKKYKNMTPDSFIKWIDDGLTYFQFRKLQDLNSSY